MKKTDKTDKEEDDLTEQPLVLPQQTPHVVY
jgi:hypothetical protein